MNVMSAFPDKIIDKIDTDIIDVSCFDFCLGVFKRFLEYVVRSKFILTNSQADIFECGAVFINSTGCLYRHSENRSKYKLVVALNGTYLNQSLNFTTNLRCILVTKVSHPSLRTMD